MDLKIERSQVDLCPFGVGRYAIVGGGSKAFTVDSLPTIEYYCHLRKSRKHE